MPCPRSSSVILFYSFLSFPSSFPFTSPCLLFLIDLSAERISLSTLPSTQITSSFLCLPVDLMWLPLLHSSILSCNPWDKDTHALISDLLCCVFLRNSLLSQLSITTTGGHHKGFTLRLFYRRLLQLLSTAPRTRQCFHLILSS